MYLLKGRELEELLKESDPKVKQVVRTLLEYQHVQKQQIEQLAILLDQTQKLLENMIKVMGVMTGKIDKMDALDQIRKIDKERDDA
jgi:hypothetical protein